MLDFRQALAPHKTWEQRVVAGLTFTQEVEVSLPKVVEDSKITARRISPRISLK
jgi:hypothetical protein